MTDASQTISAAYAALRVIHDDGHYGWNGDYEDPSKTVPTPIIRYRTAEGRPRSESALRESWRQHHGPIREGYAVMNGCGVRGCTAPGCLVCAPWKLGGRAGAAISYALAARQGRKRRGLISEGELRAYEDGGRQ